MVLLGLQDPCLSPGIWFFLERYSTYGPLAEKSGSGAGEARRETGIVDYVT